jgi:hypothetical protein
MRPGCQLFKMAFRETQKIQVGLNRLISYGSVCCDALSADGKSLLISITAL